MGTLEELKTRVRSDYAFIRDYRTRWLDNDMYSHMNNSVYNILYDSIINTYLIENCGLRPSSSAQYGMVSGQFCHFQRQLECMN